MRFLSLAYQTSLAVTSTLTITHSLSPPQALISYPPTHWGSHHLCNEPGVETYLSLLYIDGY